MGTAPAERADRLADAVAAEGLVESANIRYKGSYEILVPSTENGGDNCKVLPTGWTPL